MWVALSFGYGLGGRTVVNENKMDTRMSTIRLGFTYAIPVAENHSFKFSFNLGKRIERGPEFNAFSIAYQFRWFDEKHKNNNK
jgi:hypothetical protein